jgi:RimJ/RimL family protein N-acetyltransferase
VEVNVKTIYEVELQLYKPEFFDYLKEFKLPEEQMQFTALPQGMLEKTNEKHPIVILSMNTPVGFFVLHSSARVKDYSDNRDAMLLTALSINHTQQGKGFAKKGMRLLKAFVNQGFPDCNEIVLAVNKRNIPAQKLYQAVGYRDTARRIMGEIGEQIVLSMSV